MAWRRRATRYAWGTAAENELRKIINLQIAANCRSSKSGGLFDVWAVGYDIWLFQVKRGRFGRRAAQNLLIKLHRAVPNRTAHIYLANRTNSRGKVVWTFYYLQRIGDREYAEAA